MSFCYCEKLTIVSLKVLIVLNRANAIQKSKVSPETLSRL